MHDDRCGNAGGAAAFRDPFEVEQDIVGGLKARVRILCEARADQKVEGWRRERLELADRRRFVFQDGAEEARLALAFKRFAACDHFVEQRPEGKDVCSRVGVAAFDLLGRHVLERAENSPACRERLGRRGGHQPGGHARRGRELRQAEIEQLGRRRG